MLFVIFPFCVISVVKYSYKIFTTLFIPSKHRNERGKEMLSLVEHLLEVTPTISSVIHDASSSKVAQTVYSNVNKLNYFRVTGGHL